MPAMSAVLIGPSGRRIRQREVQGLRPCRFDGGRWRPCGEPGVDGESLVISKWCLDCEAWWPISGFYLDRAKRDNLWATCAACMRRKHARRRKAR